MRLLKNWLWIPPLLTLAASAGSASAQSLVRQPYLQMPTPTSVTIVWTTDVASNSRVRYGTSATALTQTVDLDAAVTQHEVTLTGLSPETRYSYNVGTSTAVLAGDATYYFETAPAVGTPKKFRAWILGDTGYNHAAPREVRDAMLGFVGAYKPQLFLHMGDMAYNSGTESEFTTNFFNNFPMILRNTPVWPAFGNHEGVSSDSDTQTGPYYKAYVLPAGGQAGGIPSGTEAYYSFDYGNVHFIVLDSYDSSRKTTGAMLTWLQQDLSATSQDWIIAYFHYPPYTKGSYDSDTEPIIIEMRQNALPILEAGGVDLVLAGHSHIYERSYLVDGAYDTPTTTDGHILNGGDGKTLGNGPYIKLAGNPAHDGTVYVVAGHGAYAGGAGGHPLMSFTEPQSGSCLLDVQDNRLGLINVRHDGVISDRFSMIKGYGLVLGAPDGGEHLHRGSPYDIRWATSGSIPDVKLEVSTDDGATWTTIIASTPNTGRFLWTVPQIESTTALVRISDATNAFVADESNAGFSIESASQQAIYFGDYWTYDDRGVDLGTSWRNLGYDDSGWKAGYGQLGFGDGDEETLLGQTIPAYPTAYFRKVIPINGKVTQAILKLTHDDGIAVWVNGTQVFSKYVTGTAYADYATQVSLDNELSSTNLYLQPGPFVVGSNVIAVMVKQAASGTNDLSFDMELSLTTSSVPDTSGSSTSTSSTSTSSTSTSSTSTSSTNTSSSATVSVGASVGVGVAVSSSSSTSTSSTSTSSSGGGGGPPVCITLQRGLFGAVRDATLWQDSPTWNDSINPSTYTGGGNGGVRETVLWFDLSSIPPHALVNSALLTLEQGYKTTVSTVRVHEIFSAWTESGVTWNNLGSWDTLIAGSITTGNGSGPRSVDLTDLVQDWVDGLPNTGMLLEENNADRTQWRSSEDGTPSRRPKLAICYQN